MAGLRHMGDHPTPARHLCRGHSGLRRSRPGLSSRLAPFPLWVFSWAKDTTVLPFRSRIWSQPSSPRRNAQVHGNFPTSPTTLGIAPMATQPRGTGLLPAKPYPILRLKSPSITKSMSRSFPLPGPFPCFVSSLRRRCLLPKKLPSITSIPSLARDATDGLSRVPRNAGRNGPVEPGHHHRRRQRFKATAIGTRRSRASASFT